MKMCLKTLTAGALLTVSTAFGWDINSNSAPLEITGIHHEYNGDYVKFYLRPENNPYAAEKVIHVTGLNDPEIQNMVDDWKSIYRNGQKIKWIRNNSISNYSTQNWVNSNGNATSLRFYEIKAGNDFFYRY